MEERMAKKDLHFANKGGLVLLTLHMTATPTLCVLQLILMHHSWYQTREFK
jgi:hypothetical protein